MNSDEFKKQIAVLPLCLVTEISKAAETKRSECEWLPLVKIDRCQYLQACLLWAGQYLNTLCILSLEQSPELSNSSLFYRWKTEVQSIWMTLIQESAIAEPDSNADSLAQDSKHFTIFKFFIIGGGEVYVKVREQLCGSFSPSAFSGVLGIKPRLLALLSNRFYPAHWSRLFLLLLIFIFWDSISLNNLDCPNLTVFLLQPLGTGFTGVCHHA